MGGIFISYRRQDSGPYAGRLRDALSHHFGADQVFRDIDRINPGERFPRVIEQEVGSCQALLAVIGSTWLSIKDDAGQRRLDNPGDLAARLDTPPLIDRVDGELVGYATDAETPKYSSACTMRTPCGRCMTLISLRRNHIGRFDQCAQFAVGAAVSLEQGAAGCSGEPAGQVGQIGCGVAAHGLGGKVNSFMIPSTLRLAVLPSRTSCMRDSSWVMNASGTSWADSAWARPSGKRARSVAAGASGMRMGNSVASLTNSATCGLQAQALAYQSPSRVVDVCPDSSVTGPSRSRSFFVARILT